MKKLLTVLFSLLLVAVLLPAVLHTADATTASGTCGDNLTWSLDSETGVLKIEGKGDMTWDTWYSPWDSYRSYIKTVSIGSGVTSIGDRAFEKCTDLTSVTIPDSVTSIGEGAFCDCYGLTSVSIPDSVTSIGVSAFYDCYSLTSVTIPDSVTSIGGLAFYDCGKLTSVTIPDSVTSIGEAAFASCYYLSEITIGTSIQELGYGAFSNTSWWNAQSFGLVYLNDLLLGYKGTCPETVSVKEGTRVIADGAFSNCTELKNVTLPDSLIYLSGFSGCSGISSITIPKNVQTIGLYAFQNCVWLTEISLPDSVTSIETSAFYGCKALTSVTIPDSVTSIGYSVFYNCTGLTSVSIGNNVTSIEEGAFYGCTGLTSVSIGNNVTSIEWAAFYGCTGLTSVAIPDSVTDIGNYAFDGCTGLSDVYYVGTRNQRYSNLLIYGDNEPLLDATWHYTGIPINGTIEWNSEDVQFKGATPYVIANGSAQTPRFTVKDESGSIVDPAIYTYEYSENTNAGTGYVTVTFTGDYEGTCQAFFKIYLPATTATTVENVEDGIRLIWEPVEGAAGYVIYRRAWNLKDAGWTDFVRWNNTKDLEWTDTKVYAGTRYQYGIKAYFERRYDPVAGVEIGGNVGDNFNLGMVGPLKTTVRITTRKLTSVKAGTKQMTVKWEGSKLFTGYQIQYALNSAFTKSVRTVKIKDASTMKKVIKKLKTGKKYYVRVRSYHIFEGTTYFGQWSNVKNCTVK